MSTVKHNCCAIASSGFYNTYRSKCSKTAKYERDGKWYCGTHDPVAVKARVDARNEEWKIEWAANEAQAKEKDAARILQAHKAACFDELLEALKVFVEYESAMEDRDDINGMLIYNKFSALARAAIAKATGGAA
jgi:uncharacterized Zn finger protein (UPF0148 family)